MVIRSAYRSELIEAIGNARQIGVALFEFETKFGTFPDYNTIPTVKESNPTSLVPLGTNTSNDFYRQLIVAKVVTSESMFYSETANGKQPDNRIDGSNALEKGECGFAYIIGRLMANHGPDAPILLYPLIPGERKFDYNLAKRSTNGMAVILRIDNTVTTLPIDKSGMVFINGKDIFDPTQPFWNGKVPDVKWPE